MYPTQKTVFLLAMASAHRGKELSFLKIHLMSSHSSYTRANARRPVAYVGKVLWRGLENIIYKKHVNDGLRPAPLRLRRPCTPLR